MTNKAIWKLTILPKTFMFTPKANSKQKRVKTMQEHEKVHCYWVTRLAGWLTRRGELVASKHCSLSRYSSPWRADYSPWRVVTDFCREERFFTPKTQFTSTPIPNLIGNSTYDNSTTWTSIIHVFNGFSTLLTTNLYPKPNCQIHKQQQQLHAKFNFRII